MKRGLGLLLALILVCSATACSKEASKKGDFAMPSFEVGSKDTSSAVSTQQEEEDEEPTEEPEFKPYEFDKSGILEKQVIYDDNGVVITLEKMSYDDAELVLDFSIENNRDETYIFQAGSGWYNYFSVNGYMVSGMSYEYVDIPAGEKKDMTVYVSVDEMMLYGIRCVANMTLGFTVIDEEYEIAFNTGSIELETNLASSYKDGEATFIQRVKAENGFQDLGGTLLAYSEKCAFEMDGIRSTVSAVVEYSNGTKVLYLEFENTTDDYYDALINNVIVNHVLLKDIIPTDLFIVEGKKAVAELRLSQLEEAFYKEYLDMGDIASVAFKVQRTKRGDDTQTRPGGYGEVTFSNQETDIDTSGIIVYEDDRIRLTYKAVMEDDLMDDMLVYILFENFSGETITLWDAYAGDDLLVNNIPISHFVQVAEVRDGDIGIVVAVLYASDLSDNDIRSPEDIKDLLIKVDLEKGGLREGDIEDMERIELHIQP